MILKNLEDVSKFLKKILEFRDFIAESIRDKKFQFIKNKSLIFGLEISVANITENISIELEKIILMKSLH